MTVEPDIDLHFDVLSGRVRLTYQGEEHVLPDTYESKEAAEAAAKKFAKDQLGQPDAATPSDPTVVQR
jgi:uncharacterized membrane protein YdfJ with MMPL/SSD domain